MVPKAAKGGPGFAVSDTAKSFRHLWASKPYYGKRDPDSQDLLLRDRNFSDEDAAGTLLLNFTVLSHK